MHPSSSLTPVQRHFTAQEEQTVSRTETPVVTEKEEASSTIDSKEDLDAIGQSKLNRLVRINKRGNEDGSGRKGIAANVFLRSRVFSTRNGERERYENKVLSTWHNNLIIIYSGEELRQVDATLLGPLTRYALANEAQLGGRCTLSNLLQDLKLKDSGQARKDLAERLYRLASGKFQIVGMLNGRKLKYVGSIITELMVKVDEKISFNLSKTILNLLNLHDFTAYDWDLHLGLTEQGKWAHGFFSSHTGPVVEIPWARIYELCGSNAKDLNGFCREFTRSALKPLEGKIFVGWKTRKGVLTVELAK